MRKASDSAIDRPFSPFTSHAMRSFIGPDGTNWKVEVQSPGASNAMVVFRHPDGRTSQRDRYAWYINSGAEAQDVTARLKRAAVLDSLADADLQRLYRRSMPITASRPQVEAGPSGSR
jgi:hypothetical protein